jgi:hypothetical protein
VNFGRSWKTSAWKFWTTFNAVKNVLTEHRPLDFMLIKFKELPAEKRWEFYLLKLWLYVLLFKLLFYLHTLLFMADRWEMSFVSCITCTECIQTLSLYPVKHRRFFNITRTFLIVIPSRHVHLHISLQTYRTDCFSGWLVANRRTTRISHVQSPYCLL